MSIGIVKVENDYIILGVDTQSTYGESTKVNDFIDKLVKLDERTAFAVAGHASLSSLLESYLKHADDGFSLEQIHTSLDVYKFLHQITDFYKEPIPDISEIIENSEIIIVVNRRAWVYAGSLVKEVTEGTHAAIGSGCQSALVGLALEDSVEKVLQAVGKYNLFCSEDYIIRYFNR